MRGDFSRVTYDPTHSFSQVLFQQGQDLVDSEFNEQTDIIREQVRAAGQVAAQALQKAGGPTYRLELNAQVEGAKVTLTPSFTDWVFVPGYGRYDFGAPFPQATYDRSGCLVFYLDTVEEIVRAESEPEAMIADPALGPRDCSLRLRPVTRLLALPVKDRPPSPKTEDELQSLFDGGRTRKTVGQLRPVLATPGAASASKEPGCESLATATYRGVENQLYRVEVQGISGDSNLLIKWSRDNAAVTYPILLPQRDPAGGVTKLKVVIVGTWSDDRWAIRRGNAVELIPRSGATPKPGEAAKQPRPLFVVEAIDVQPSSVELTLVGTGVTDETVTEITQPSTARRDEVWGTLVRWDHDPAEGDTEQSCAVVDVKHPPANCLRIEDGLEVEFHGDITGFRPRDYWLIPLRIATGEALWKKDQGGYTALEPHGPRHCYTPLTLVDLAAAKPAAEPFPWDADALPNQGVVLPPAVVGAAHPKDVPDDPLKTDTITPEADRTKPLRIAEVLEDIRLPVRYVFTVRQLLVHILGELGDPLLARSQPFAPQELVEAARRLSFTPTTLRPLIVKRVGAAVESSPIATLLKTTPPAGHAWSPTTVLASDKLDPTTIKGGSTSAAIKKKIKSVYATIGQVAAAASAKAVAIAMNALPEGSEPTPAQIDEVQKVWEDAQRARFYLLAWPFATITAEDWKPT